MTYREYKINCEVNDIKVRNEITKRLITIRECEQKMAEEISKRFASNNKMNKYYAVGIVNVTGVEMLIKEIKGHNEENDRYIDHAKRGISEFRNTANDMFAMSF